MRSNPLYLVKTALLCCCFMFCGLQARGETLFTFLLDPTENYNIGGTIYIGPAAWSTVAKTIATEFSTPDAIVRVDELGFFDDEEGVGFPEREVAILSMNSNLISSVVISEADGLDSNGFRWDAVTNSVVLAPTSRYVLVSTMLAWERVVDVFEGVGLYLKPPIFDLLNSRSTTNPLSIHIPPVSATNRASIGANMKFTILDVYQPSEVSGVTLSNTMPVVYVSNALQTVTHVVERAVGSVTNEWKPVYTYTATDIYTNWVDLTVSNEPDAVFYRTRVP